ncbi:uncharacterized protein LOC135681911 [Rhopilema esculentum]|uniref:uncharacterized protein LOC135681911 n=1 Tax=Rhopilema esculentum TaxID=499914 RepID=UPI0031D77FA9
MATTEMEPEIRNTSSRKIRGPGRNAFIKSAAERKQADKRYCKSIQRKLEKWLKTTGLPAVLLTFHKDKDGKLHVMHLGDPAFAGFAQNQTVKTEFQRVALNVMKRNSFQQINRKSKKQKQVINQFVVETIEKNSLQSLQNEFAINDKRKLITQAVLGNCEMKKHMWQEKYKPVWWPEHVPFVSPNSGSRETKRPIVAILDVILESLFSYVRKSEVSATEDCDDEMGAREEDTTTFNESDEEMDEEERMDEEVAEEQTKSDEAASGVEEQERHLRDGEACQEHNEDISAASEELGRTRKREDKTRLSIREKASLQFYKEAVKNYSWSPENCEDFLETFKGCSKLLLREYVRLLPTEHAKPIESHVSRKQIEQWYRNYVPPQLLETGREPIKVKADGTCLYRSVSTALFGDENNWCWIKLSALRYGLLHEQEVMQKLLDLQIDVSLLRYIITTDDIADKFARIEDENERLLKCVREETLRTADKYRYATLLHLFLIAGAFDVNVHSFSPQSELRRIIYQGDDCGDVFLLWVPTTVGRSVNHIVPLVVPERDEANCFSDNCGLGSFCIKAFDDVDEETSEVRCELCLRTFHTRCAVVSNLDTADTTKWRCFCHYKQENLTSLSCFRNAFRLKQILLEKKGDIRKFVNAISKGTVYSAVMRLFCKGKFSDLRTIGRRLWMLNDETAEVLSQDLYRHSVQVGKFRNLDVTKRITLINSVFMPEVIAFIIHKENMVPLVYSRKVVFEANEEV